MSGDDRDVVQFLAQTLSMAGDDGLYPLYRGKDGLLTCAHPDYPHHLADQITIAVNKRMGLA